MSIKLVVNGYFRSGTTFIWDHFKRYLSGQDWYCFYEPLHPMLAYHVQNEFRKKSTNSLHGMLLWEDYTKLSEEKLLEILRANKTNKTTWLPSDNEIIYYLDQFDDLGKAVFLQTNRLHFHLRLLMRRKDIKVIHVIRGPLSVFDSIKRVYLTHGSRASLLYRNMLYPFVKGDAFETDAISKWVLKNIGLPFDFYENLLTRLTWKLNLADRFALAWVVSNYCAIRDVKQGGGLLLSYERLAGNPECCTGEIRKYVEMNELPLLMPIRSKHKQYSQKVRIGWIKRLERLGISNYYEVIKTSVCEEIISDWP